MSQLFIGGLVFDGRNMHAPGLGVLVAAGRVAAVEPAASFAGFDGTVVDTSDATLMPGPIDGHVHLSFGAEDDPDQCLADVSDAVLSDRIAARTRATLAGGVVCVRDCGGTGRAEFAIRDAIETGELIGARVRACGPIIRPDRDGFGDLVAVEVKGVSQMAAAVKDALAHGADFVNVMATSDPFGCGDDKRRRFDQRELFEAVQVAAAGNCKVASNAQCVDDIARAVHAGVVSIEQGSDLDDRSIDLMLEHGTALVPCLLARRNINAAMTARGETGAVYERALALEQRTREACARFAKAGGTVIMGTDCGAPGTDHGTNSHELVQLIEAGLTPLDALRAGTTNAAKVLELDDSGAVAPGMRADLLVVEGDPIDDIRGVCDRTHHRALFVAGERLDPANG